MQSSKEQTAFLTKVGYLFLRGLGCTEISTEVKLLRLCRNFKNKKDRHFVIDLLGIQREYLPPSPLHKGVNSQLILRGIEIKVSKADANNGYIHNGCTFNYIMFPRGLLRLSEVQEDVGVIEVDIPNFFFNKKRRVFQVDKGYVMRGVDLRRKPKRKEVSEIEIRRCQNQISRTLTNQVKRWIIDDLSTSESVPSTLG